MEHEHKQAFAAAYNGRFSGILRWGQFDQLWQALAASPEGWHVYEPEAGGPPGQPLSGEEMKAFMARAEKYLRELCGEDFCGAVYADSLPEPSFIKIYNPRLMGGCGMGKAPWPQWVISRIAPIALEKIEEMESEEKPSKGGILSRLGLGQH